VLLWWVGGEYESLGEGGRKSGWRGMEFYGLFVFLVEQFLNNNKKTLFSIMDIEMSTTPVLDSSIFTSISGFNTFQLYQQQVALESSFFASPHHTHQSLMLTLIDNTLLLSDPNAELVQPHSAVALNFDLKFEVLYQTQVLFPSFRKMFFPQKLDSAFSTTPNPPSASSLPS
jgi:hypothetical protein